MSSGNGYKRSPQDATTSLFVNLRGGIAAAAGFPTLASVLPGDFYLINVDVTDNDPSKTNTGTSFQAGDGIVWNGKGWTNIGGFAAGQASRVAWGALASGDIPARALLQTDAAGLVTKAGASTLAAFGANANDAIVLTGATVPVVVGRVQLKASAPFNGNVSLKAAANGRVTPHITSQSDIRTLASSAGAAFANQPNNDRVQVVSSNAGDVGQVVTVIGTTNGGHVVVRENIVLNGTTPVQSVKADWGVIVAFKLSAVTVGNVTLSKTTGPATIKQLNAGGLAMGVVTPAGNNVYAWGGAGNLYAAGGATTKEIACNYTRATDETTTADFACALNGATANQIDAANGVWKINELYVGDVEAGRTATADNASAPDNLAIKVARALAPAAAVGDSAYCLLTG